jgi:hypothetical protein
LDIYLFIRNNTDSQGCLTVPKKAQEPGEPNEVENQLSTRRVPPLSLAPAISSLTVLAWRIPALLARRSAKPGDSSEEIIGGWNISSLLYAIWNEFSFVLVGPALMAHFQCRRNQSATSWLWQARYSYAAYLLHSPISVIVEVLVDWLPCVDGTGVGVSKILWWRIVGPVLFTGVVSLVNAAASFALGRFLFA